MTRIERICTDFFKIRVDPQKSASSAFLFALRTRYKITKFQNCLTIVFRKTTDHVPAQHLLLALISLYSTGRTNSRTSAGSKNGGADYGRNGSPRQRYGDCQQRYRF